MREFGRLAAADAVLNNFDRLPAAHKNEGNADNYLISPDGHVCVVTLFLFFLLTFLHRSDVLCSRHLCNLLACLTWQKYIVVHRSL